MKPLGSSSTPWCPGVDKKGNECPVKDSCMRFKENINKLKEFYLDFAPFSKDGDRTRCSYKITRPDEQDLNLRKN
jgi:hypothetical protein